MSLTTTTEDNALRIRISDTKEHVNRTPISNGPDKVVGNFFFVLDITSITEAIYLPLSIASGKKPTGFVYQIEGTVPGIVATTDITCRGEGITQITFGTITYCKIPVGMTATIKIHIQVRGQLGKAYRVVICQMQYKRSPRDTRYQKSIQDIHTKMVKFV